EGELTHARAVGGYAPDMRSRFLPLALPSRSVLPLSNRVDNRLAIGRELRRCDLPDAEQIRDRDRMGRGRLGAGMNRECERHAGHREESCRHACNSLLILPMRPAEVAVSLPVVRILVLTALNVSDIRDARAGGLAAGRVRNRRARRVGTPAAPA